MNKIIPYLINKDDNPILEIDTTFYNQQKSYLGLSHFSFDKHSLILGSSGSGKSKFISLFIKNILKQKELNEKYRIIVIDPHAALEKDIGGLEKSLVIDFKTTKNSVSLFDNNTSEITSKTEIYLDLFKSFINDQYNSKLERVLRYTICLLLYDNSFNFSNLKKILLELEFRNNLLKKIPNLPESVNNFFLTDFNELRTKSYMEAISPIISFIEELDLLPIFNNKEELPTILETINKNFLTLFSLDTTKLGIKITKTIALLIMQQIFTLIQTYLNYHIIFIIDEISVIENPIISRFLSEARKYNLSLILIGQYLNQINENIRKSIFANVINYFIFRISQADSIILVDNLNMELLYNDNKENRIKLLTELNNRELIARILIDDKLLPAFKGKSLPLIAVPRKDEKKYIKTNNKNEKKNTLEKTFKINHNIKLKDILINNSTSRKDLKNNE